MPGPVARVHALSLGHATTLRARRACTHTYIASRSQTRRSAPLPPSVSSSYAGVLLLSAMLLHHALAPLPSTNSEARATATCVRKHWKSFFQPVRLQPDVARHARAPAPLGSRREVSHERPSQDKTRRHCGTRRARPARYVSTVGILSKPGHLFSRGDGGSHGRQPQPLP